MSCRYVDRERRQAGQVLPVLMLILVILSLLIVNGLQTAAWQARLLGQHVQRQGMFLEAESSLVQAERVLHGWEAGPLPGCLQGVCGSVDDEEQVRWRNAHHVGWAGMSVTQEVAAAPARAYRMAEYLGCRLAGGELVPSVPADAACVEVFYRVTVRLENGEGQQVMLQSTVSGEVAQGNGQPVLRDIRRQAWREVAG